MVGNCNGIVCMQLFDKEFMEKKKYILFGNPNSGVYKVILNPVLSSLLSGFIYDSSHDDYICVMVDLFTRDIHMYSLKSNSWRIKSASFRLEPILPRVGVALDTSLYWLYDDINRIIVYDVKHDQFTEISLPIEMPKTKLGLNIVGRSICVTNVCLETGEVEMWLVCKQEEKWSRFLSVNLEEEFGIFAISPLCFSSDGRVLCDMRYNSRTLFVLIDPKTESVEDLTVIDEFGGVWLAPVELSFLDRHMLYPCLAWFITSIDL